MSVFCAIKKCTACSSTPWEQLEDHEASGMCFVGKGTLDDLWKLQWSFSRFLQAFFGILVKPHFNSLIRCLWLRERSQGHIKRNECLPIICLKMPKSTLYPQQWTSCAKGQCLKTSLVYILLYLREATSFKSQGLGWLQVSFIQFSNSYLFLAQTLAEARTTSMKWDGIYNYRRCCTLVLYSRCCTLVLLHGPHSHDE